MLLKHFGYLSHTSHYPTDEDKSAGHKTKEGLMRSPLSLEEGTT